MKLFFAVSNSIYWAHLLKNDAKNILHSFAYKDHFLKVMKENTVENKSLLIDSGAFTAWTKKTSINLDEYIDFCKFIMKNYPNNEWRPINLDVIPGEFGKVPTQTQIEYSAQKGWENYEYMQSKGFKPIHIFHQHEDFKWLHKLIASSDYIGISPDNSQSVQSRCQWLKKVYAIVKDKVKTHGFACTGTSFLKVAPFYSADSSSWMLGPKYGIITYYDPASMSIKMIKLKDCRADITFFHKLRDEVYPKISSSVGASLIDILKGEASTKFLLACAILAQTELQEAYTKLWEKRGIKFNS